VRLSLKLDIYNFLFEIITEKAINPLQYYFVLVRDAVIRRKVGQFVVVIFA
jgi:hypothetical protein